MYPLFFSQIFDTEATQILELLSWEKKQSRVAMPI